MGERGSVVISLSVTAVLLLVVLVICGELVRVERLIHEHHARIEVLESMVIGNTRLNTVQSSTKRRIVLSEALAQEISKPMKEYNKNRNRRSVHIQRNSTAQGAKEFAREIAKHLSRAVLKICRTETSDCYSGPRGPPGRPGRKGRKGDPGRRGQKGDPGRRGQNGRPGLRGSMGMPGRRGRQRIVGSKGMKGERGERGPKGQKGVAGPRGLSIRQGNTGESSFSAPVVMVSPPLITVNASESAVFHCSSSGVPKPVLVWSKIKGAVPEKSSVRLLGDGRMVIENTTLNDSGLYECKASNIMGESMAAMRLVVTVPPKVWLDSGPTYVQQGHNVMLPMCHVTGFPHPEVNWTKASSQLPRARTITSEGQLSILATNANDSGDYFCRAFNHIGSAIARTQLVVFSLPRFVVRPPDSVQARVSSFVSLPCHARGEPTPVISWQKQGGLLPHGRFELSDEVLTVRDLTMADSGVYICTAISAGLFDAMISTQLVVLGRGCWDLNQAGEMRNGVYEIDPDGHGPFPVYCDMTTAGGGWTVFQRRQDGAVDFQRDWNRYKTGFGNLTGEFWLGSDKIHRLTSGTVTSLRVDLMGWGGQSAYATYDRFAIANETERYRLMIAGYSGIAGDSLVAHNNEDFTTTNETVNGKHDMNCAAVYGWWKSVSCNDSNLNGQYLGDVLDKSGISWKTFAEYHSLKFTEMKLRRQRSCQGNCTTSAYNGVLDRRYLSGKKLMDGQYLKLDGRKGN